MEILLQPPPAVGSRQVEKGIINNNTNSLKKDIAFQCIAFTVVGGALMVTFLAKIGGHMANGFKVRRYLLPFTVPTGVLSRI